MQKPRRTSELHDLRDEFHHEGAVTKRQTRQMHRSVVTPSPQLGTGLLKCGRKTRLRQPSLERDRPSYLPTPLQSTSASVRTPKRQVPLNIYKTVPLTAERKGNALHNDKKWIQDQAQRICDYLLEMAAPGGIPGIGSDFYTRGNNLRHMSIKQFVGIINFFLQFIWRNRYTVGSNHVDEIINILQRLNYPYQVNKSWLITPNTQHSFGHVVVMLTFLKDFAPPSPSELTQFIEHDHAHNPYEFVLAEECPSLPQNSNNPDVISIAATVDREFHTHMLKKAAEAFELWDKQMMDDYDNLQQLICNMLIHKCCNLTDSAALDVKLTSLQKELDELQKQLPPLSQNDESKAEELTEEEQQLGTNIEKCLSALKELEDEYEKNKQQQTCGQTEELQLTAEIKQLTATVSQQKYTVQQHNHVTEEYNQRQNELEVHQRALNDLQNRNLNQQVLLSRTKKRLTDLIEQFNGNIRDVHYSGAGTIYNIDSLQLPLNPQIDSVQQCGKVLNILRAKIDSNYRSQHKCCLEVQKKINEIESYIKSQLKPKLNQVQFKFNSNVQRLQENKINFTKNQSIMKVSLEELDKQKQKLIMLQQEQHELHLLKLRELKEKETLNEKYLSNAEKEHTNLVNKRLQQLEIYNSSLGKLKCNIQEMEYLSTHCDEQLLEKLEELITSLLGSQAIYLIT